ncbi:MAG: EscU/YscU/HrcU family type III secretion system export apparatus switch protein [Rhodomicrobium sp.]|jgi:type III secretion system FlhB-like substrate exporter
MTGTGKDRESGAATIAVALHYEGNNSLPRLTAKGEGDVAAEIVRTAKASGVHVEYNEPLARSLAALELEQQIPKELYRAVAEVIGFVLRKAGPARKPAAR